MADFIEYPVLIQNTANRALLILAIVVLTFLLERIIRHALKKGFERSSYFLQVDKTQYAVVRHLISAIIYIVGMATIIYLVPPLRTLGISIFAGAGLLAVIIGFASQQAFSNIISGLFIAIFKPFRVGDTIKFGERTGEVEDITLRHTVVRNFENKRFIVPNSVISSEVIENFNIEDEKVCRYVEIGISFDSNMDKAIGIMQKEAAKHPEFLDTRTEEEKRQGKPEVTVRVIGFGESSVNLRAWAWAKNPGAAFRLGTDLNKSIKERFDREGIEIPYPYRTIVMRSPKRKRKS